MIRLFIALPIPEETRQELASLCNGLPGARWVPPENLHLTLRFVGEVEGDIAQDLAHGLSRIDTSGFEVDLHELTWFGTKKKPSVVCVKARKTDALLHLQKKVESVCVREGLKPESRKFCPHVTLARLRAADIHQVERYLRHHRPERPIRFDADRFVLYSSFLSASGPIYTEEADYQLNFILEPAE